MNKKKNPKMKQFNVRVTAEELEVLRRSVWDNNTSISKFVYGLIKPYIYPPLIDDKNNP